MSLSALIDREAITTDLQALEKEEVIRELIDLLEKTGKVKDKNQVVNELLEREAKGSTGLEKGIAVPHVKTSAVDELCIAIGISKEGVEFGAIDGKYSYIFFLILAPRGAAAQHIEVLSEIMTFVTPPINRERLKKANSPDGVIQIIQEYENNI